MDNINMANVEINFIVLFYLIFNAINKNKKNDPDDNKKAKKNLKEISSRLL